MNDGAKQDIEVATADSIAPDYFQATTDVVQPFTAAPALICLSHLRWDFVYQRPQHLMSRFARHRQVVFFEEPKPGALALDVRMTSEGVTVLVPRLPESLGTEARLAAQRQLLDRYLASHGIADFVLWYYTPMSLGFSDHLAARAVVYDCMDELSAFRGAPPELLERERELLRRADLVLTGGRSLFEAKRRRHADVHEFASAVDTAHFAAARRPLATPADQAAIAGPRLGFFGVIDERFDITLLDAVAKARPDWQFVMLGPVVKIGADELPRHANIHYLGLKTYAELPAYIAGWDVALMPFARNESTRYISPTKTPEYLAAGKPVVSTSIADVVAAYGHCTAVHIADTAADFIAAVSAALLQGQDRSSLLQAADAALAGRSWDGTWLAIDALVAKAIA